MIISKRKVLEKLLSAQDRKPNRLGGYDYSLAGYYFVTICTKGHRDHFGAAAGGKMHLNKTGILAKHFWLTIPEHYSGVRLDEFAIMPDHIHGILIIECESSAIGNVGTEHCSVPTVTRFPNGKHRHYGLLSKIVKSYKNELTNAIKSIPNTAYFSWQRSFYDRVIRDDEELKNIRSYINQNPLKWEINRLQNSAGNPG